MYVLLFFFFISYGNFYLLGSFVLNQNAVRTLSSPEKLDLGLNKLFFPVKKKKKNHSAKEQAGCR